MSSSSTHGPTVQVDEEGTFALQPGDLLLKQSDGSLTNTVIKVGQTLTGARHRDYVHAAIAVDARHVVEIGGEGIHRNDILTTNAGYTYAVFRCRNQALAAGAAAAAELLLAGVGNDGAFDIKYAYQCALSSLGGGRALHDEDRINKVLDVLVGGGRELFFCSGLAVWCYVVAMEQTALEHDIKRERNGLEHDEALDHFWALFDVRPEDYSPARLYERLLGDSDCFIDLGILNRGRIANP